MATAQPNAPLMKIIVGVDFSEMSDHAVSVALSMARSAGAAEVHLVHVLPPPLGGTEFAPMVDITEMTRAGREQLERMIEKASAVKEATLFSHVLVGSAAGELPRVADEIEADLIVVGTHGRRGVDRMLFGSVAETVVRSAPCSVLTVRPKPKSAADSIEPPCPDCFALTQKTAGKQQRCAQHTKHRAHAHTYSEFPPSYGLGSMTFRF